MSETNLLSRFMAKETNRLLATYITLAIQETIKYQNMKK